MTEVIVALDFNTRYEALNLIDQLDARHCALKVGSELFTLLGASFIKELIARQFKVFLDLKFHDIPNTVAKACAVAADLGVWMINVHALGGIHMMSRAKQSLERYGKDAPLIIAVTVLTSLQEEEMRAVGIEQGLQEQVVHLAGCALSAGLDGVVCSAHEVKAIKKACGTNFLTVTPGIRLPTDTSDDQSRIMTPVKAAKEGSDYLVIGRPITQSKHPLHVLSAIKAELASSC